MASCAGCHRASGEENGEHPDLIGIATPDLTTIRQRMEMAVNDFPYRNTLILIDGRSAIRAHGSHMPVWGDRHSSRGLGHWFRGPDEETRELAALGRIPALVHYIESIREQVRSNRGLRARRARVCPEMARRPRAPATPGTRREGPRVLPRQRIKTTGRMRSLACDLFRGPPPLVRGMRPLLS